MPHTDCAINLKHVLERTNSGHIKWTRPVDIVGSYLGTLRGTDAEETVAYYLSMDPDLNEDGGPSISIYGYDPIDDEMEMCADDMELSEYMSTEDREALRNLILVALKASA